MAATPGEPGAELNLGSCTTKGGASRAPYRTERIPWYRLAAEQGNAAGQAALGMMYHDGHGVVQDFDAALSWFHAAAAQGSPAGQAALGIMYYEGQASRWITCRLICGVTWPAPAV